MTKTPAEGDSSLRADATGCPLVTVYVDADAAPRDALATVDRLTRQVSGLVVSVSTYNHAYDRTGHITVDPHPQAVDMEIIRRIDRQQPTVVVTQDYGLAALALAKGARVVSVHGAIFTAENIDRFLFERELNARERRATGRSRGPKPRSTADRQRFELALRQVLNEFRSPNQRGC